MRRNRDNYSDFSATFAVWTLILQERAVMDLQTPGRMHVRYYVDSRTGLPHIYGHDVSEGEVEEILPEYIHDMWGRENSGIAIGQTSAGRYLKVIYVPDPVPDSVFVITAYELGAKAKRAIRRKRRRRK